LKICGTHPADAIFVVCGAACGMAADQKMEPPTRGGGDFIFIVCGATRRGTPSEV
jgi:hypothetical protein